jgi:hypothetical protein
MDVTSPAAAGMPSRPSPASEPGRTRLTLRHFGIALTGLGVVALGATACVLSFDDIRLLAMQGRARTDLAYLYPAGFDALLAVALISVLLLRAARLPVRIQAAAVLVLLLLAAVTVEVATAVDSITTLNVRQAAIGVAVSPWVMLSVALWLWLLIIKHAHTRRGTAVEQAGRESDILPFHRPEPHLAPPPPPEPAHGSTQPTEPPTQPHGHAPATGPTPRPEHPHDHVPAAGPAAPPEHHAPAADPTPPPEHHVPAADPTPPPEHPHDHVPAAQPEPSPEDFAQSGPARGSGQGVESGRRGEPPAIPALASGPKSDETAAAAVEPAPPSLPVVGPTPAPETPPLPPRQPDLPLRWGDLIRGDSPREPIGDVLVHPRPAERQPPEDPQVADKDADTQPMRAVSDDDAPRGARRAGTAGRGPENRSEGGDLVHETAQDAEEARRETEAQDAGPRRGTTDTDERDAPSSGEESAPPSGRMRSTPLPPED